MSNGQCPGDSVGAIIRTTVDNVTYYLLLHRAWWPLGLAPGAGHVRDEHSDPLTAVRTEVTEEFGLTVVAERELITVSLPNLCSSPPADPAGHDWIVYDVDVTGRLNPSQTETLGAVWVTASELTAAARITVDHARQGGAARDLPGGGLEAVWVELLCLTGDLPTTGPDGLTDVDRVDAERLYTTHPDAYWTGRSITA